MRFSMIIDDQIFMDMALKILYAIGISCSPPRATFMIHVAMCRRELRLRIDTFLL